jgi:ribonuclease BN (tRNA processing enzyme)
LFQSVACDVSRYDELLLCVKVIWLSHHHADHITGVPMLLEQIQRAKLRKEAAATAAAASQSLSQSQSQTSSRRMIPAAKSKYDMRSMFAGTGHEAGKVMVIGSEAVLKYLEFSACVSGLDEFVSFYPIVNTLYAGATKDISAATEGAVTRLRSIPVQHCHSSYGLVLDFDTKHKIVYSGDCRPSMSLVKAGNGCDLLIHEATFSDTKAADAAKKKHSTSSEARRVAAQMGAKHTVLTHFSQRYPLEVASAVNDLSSTGSSRDQLWGYPSAVGAGAAGAGGSGGGSGGGGGGGMPSAAVAYDFLRFSFPSQAAVLPQVTAALGLVLTAVEAARREQRLWDGSYQQQQSIPAWSLPPVCTDAMEDGELVLRAK